MNRRAAPLAGSAVASPCINVCEMDTGSGLCRGCFRTLEEITGWSRAADDDKRAILAAVDYRRADAFSATDDHD